MSENRYIVTQEIKSEAQYKKRVLLQRYYVRGCFYDGIVFS